MTLSDQINMWIAIATGAGTLVTAAVCFATFQSLKATRSALDLTRKQILDQRRAYVVIAANPGKEISVVMLHIRNLGEESATNVRLTLDRDFYFNGEEGPENNLRGYWIFNHVIASLPPKADIELLLGAGHSIFAGGLLCPLQFQVTAEYISNGIQFSEATVVDLSPFGKHTLVKSPHLSQLEKLTSAVESVAASLNRS